MTKTVEDQSTVIYDLEGDGITARSGESELNTEFLEAEEYGTTEKLPSTSAESVINDKNEKSTVPSSCPQRDPDVNERPFPICNTTLMCFLPKPVIYSPPMLPPNNSTSYTGVVRHIQTLLFSAERCESVKFALQFYNLKM